MSHAVGIRSEALVGHELGELEDVAESCEEAIVAARDHELAVPRREDLIRRDHRERRSLSGRHGAVGQVADEVVADVAERRLVERRVDNGSLAGSLAFEQCRDDPERGPHPGAHVDERGADPHTRPIGLARHADEPSRRLHERVVAGLLGERADVAVRADRAVDEAWVPLAQRLGAEAEPLGEPGAKALEEHVGPVDEPQHGVAAALVAQRHGERALPRVHREEHRALPVPERRAPRAPVVTRVRPLDLHHVGAERGEDLGAVRPGDRRRDVDDAHAFEGTERHRRNHPCLRGCADARLARLRPLHRVGLRRVVELPRHLRRRRRRRVLPARPERDTRRHRWEPRELRRSRAAGSSSSRPPRARSSATTSRSGSATSSARRPSSGSSAARSGTSDSSGRSETLDERGAYIIIIARFIPGGRTAVTFSAGYVNTFPWRRFIVYDVAAGLLWATYAALLGYFGGKTFEDNPLLGSCPRSGSSRSDALGFVVEARQALPAAYAAIVSDSSAPTAQSGTYAHAMNRLAGATSRRISSSTPRTRSTGTSGATRRSSALGPRTSRSSSRSATARATGAT